MGTKSKSTTSDNDTATWHCITMPRGTDNATCHTHGHDKWHF